MYALPTQTPSTVINLAASVVLPLLSPYLPLLLLMLEPPISAPAAANTCEPYL
jgi:hypothetical protein